MSIERLFSRLIRLALIAMAAVLLLNIAEIMIKNTKPHPTYRADNIIVAMVKRLDNSRRQ